MAYAERLAPPGKIKFNSQNLAEDWRKWKEEFSRYVSLTVKDEDASKLQLFKERLLRTPDVNLGKCVDMCRTAEITKQGISVLDGTSALTPAINKISKQSTRKPDDNKKKTSEKQKYKQCKFCGSSDSDDYYQSNSVTNSDEDESVNTLNSKTAQATMLIQGQKFRLQLDTGATFSIPPINHLRYFLPLRPTNIRMYNGITIKPLGKLALLVTNSKNQMTQEADFVIIKDNCTPLLGNNTLQDMELLQWNSENILTISNYSPITKEQLLTEYKNVFEGIGRLEGDFNLVVDKFIPPVAHPPRRVLLALKAQLKDKLDRLENLNIIAQVSEPTPWVSSCLMVVKPNKLRICIDPKDLNKALKRSYYPLPTIEEVLQQLTKAKVFSILDAKNGFWHVQMDHESSLLTTFNTPFGRYRWLRMPFGLSTAPEEY
ncbi:uncharacterized protein K02A2.6-like [Saccostrea echinata]|uniref:uncharacterized protein K02A2.6-like n=1 Tax=Saccostrea echinata TaxID=191078 RepID=UPI002A8064BA|nr:uncharacterized protein K02A2.6-like [Saccostrea echinata]